MTLTTRRGAPGSRDEEIRSLRPQTLVYLEPTWKLHSAYRSLLQDPPEGYRFEVGSGSESAAINAASRLSLSYASLAALDRVIPIYLVRSYWNALKRRPAGTSLTYSVNHLVLRDEPWVLDLPCEHPASVLGGYRRFRGFKGLVQSALSSPNCRKIIVSIDASRTALEAALGPEIAHKADVVYWSVPRKESGKSFSRDRVKLLFVNSGNIPGQARIKGVREAMEAFVLLRRRYPFLEMVVRSDIPGALKKRHHHAEGLRIIDKVMPWDELEREFMTADIFVLPSHITPQTVFLDAMSYELPVVTTDAWGNPEIVEDGVTGLLVRDSPVAAHRAEMLPRYFTPPPGSHAYREIVTAGNPEMVRGLVEKLSLLIEDPELRRRMGRAGRAMVESGRFSMERRNSTLKRVLDEAIAGPS